MKTLTDKSIGQQGPYIQVTNGTKEFELNIFENNVLDLNSLGSITLYYPYDIIGKKGKLHIIGDGAAVITFKGEGWDSDDFIGDVTFPTFTPAASKRNYLFNERGLISSKITI